MRASPSLAPTGIDPKLFGRGLDADGHWTDDHIIPKNAYDSTEEDLLRCHNSRNRRPLGVRLATPARAAQTAHTSPDR